MPADIPVNGEAPLALVCNGAELREYCRKLARLVPFAHGVPVPAADAVPTVTEAHFFLLREGILDGAPVDAAPCPLSIL